MKIKLNRALTICALIAVVFLITGIFIGQAVAAGMDKPTVSKSDEQVCLWEPAEPEIQIEDTYDYVPFVATAYCKCTECNDEYGTDDTDGHALSATGAKLQESVSVAADFSVLPPNTQIEISGMGIYTVHDCGGDIKGNRLDIYFEYHEDAEAFGVQTVNVRKLEEN